MLRLLEERLDALKGAKQSDFDAVGLCLVPNIVIPPNGNVSKLGEAWWERFLDQYKYNMDMAPNRSQLQNMVKGDRETFKGYAQFWRELAACIQPPLSENEMAAIFIDILHSPFYEKMMGNMVSNFSDLVLIGERIEPYPIQTNFLTWRKKKQPDASSPRPPNADSTNRLDLRKKKKIVEPSSDQEEPHAL
ncbi:hypothetical protein CR513_12294, partial [Mucuna pruriens]